MSETGERPVDELCLIRGGDKDITLIEIAMDHGFGKVTPVQVLKVLPRLRLFSRFAQRSVIL